MTPGFHSCESVGPGCLHCDQCGAPPEDCTCLRDEDWTSVQWMPPPTIAKIERKPRWKFWRKPRVLVVATGEPGYFVVVKRDGSVMTSPDAITWTRRPA